MLGSGPLSSFPIASSPDAGAVQDLAAAATSSATASASLDVRHHLAAAAAAIAGATAVLDAQKHLSAGAQSQAVASATLDVQKHLAATAAALASATAGLDSAPATTKHLAAAAAALASATANLQAAHHLAAAGQAQAGATAGLTAGAVARTYPDAGDPWAQAWAEAQASVSSDKVELVTLELLHPAFVDELGHAVAIRAVRDTQDHALLLEGSAPLNPNEVVTFTAIPFDMPWPEIEEGRSPTLSIKIDNVGRELVPYLDGAAQMQAPVQVILRVYIWDQNDGSTEPGIDPISFMLRQVTVSESYIEGQASPADLANMRALRLIYDLETYPGLDYVNG